MDSNFVGLNLLEHRITELEKEVEKLKSIIDDRLIYLESQCQIMTGLFSEGKKDKY